MVRSCDEVKSFTHRYRILVFGSYPLAFIFFSPFFSCVCQNNVDNYHFGLSLYFSFFSFAITPKQVTGVVGRAELCSSMGFLIAFIFYVKSTHVKKKRLKSKCECVRHAGVFDHIIFKTYYMHVFRVFGCLCLCMRVCAN